MTILDEIAEYTKERYIREEKEVPFSVIEKRCADIDSNTGFPFEKALAKKGLSYICEVKKASPSKGLIAKDFPMCRLQRNMRMQGRLPYPALQSLSIFRGKTVILGKSAAL